MQHLEPPEPLEADSVFASTAYDSDSPAAKRTKRAASYSASDDSGSDLGGGFRSSQESDNGYKDDEISAGSDDEFVVEKRAPPVRRAGGIKVSAASKAKYSTDAGPAARLPTLASTSGPKAGGGDLVSSIFPDDRDFTFLPLKPDHSNRPFYISPANGNIILEAFHLLAQQATDFLIAIAEPVSRPSHIHEYKLTPHSLYAAVSVGLKTEDIIEVLNRMSKVPVPDKISDFIRDCTVSYGKVKLVLKKNKHYVESGHAETLRILLRDDIIAKARAVPTEADAAKEGEGTATYGLEKDKAPKRAGLVIPGTKVPGDPGTEASGAEGAEDKGEGKGKEKAVEDDLFTAVVGLEKGSCFSFFRGNRTMDPLPFLSAEDDMDDDDEVHAFEIQEAEIETVKRRCLDLDYPMMEEYDFRHDELNPTLEIDLKPTTTIRNYQEKSLGKMFGNG